MKKIIRCCLFFIFIIFLVSCSKGSDNEINDLILTPELDSPVLQGTWQVSKVKNITGVNNTNSPKIGDKLYVNNNLVAINKEYAFPPTFTSKYVNLSDYLINRGYNFDNVAIDENVVVVNASQGQFFSRDFIKRSDDEIFYIADDNIVFLSKISDDVDSEVINSFKVLAIFERSKDKNPTKNDEDEALLLSVRERDDLADKDVEYNYYTYFIKIPKDLDITYKKSDDIFIKGKDEYWKIRSKKNNLSGLYDNIEAFPARLEDQMDQKENIDRYSFKDFDMDLRINFADINYISFSYTKLLFDNSINKYGFLATNELQDNTLISIDEFTGENTATEQFEYMVLNEATSADSEIKPNDIIIDNTNFGLVRDLGNWTIQTSIYTKEKQIKASTQIPMRNHLDNSVANPIDITKDQVRNINPQFKDYYLFNDGKYILIQTADEILIHKINKDYIEKKPIFSIPTDKASTLISIDQQSGSSVKNLEENYLNNNEIIDSNWFYWKKFVKMLL